MKHVFDITGDRVFRVFKNLMITAAVLAVSYCTGLLMLGGFDAGEHITTLFVFAVFIVSLATEGYFYGIMATFVGVFLVNYAFLDPYYDLDFTVPENVLSAVVMIVISLLTSALTTQLKRWQALKAEADNERMRANLLRAVSHDLRTPLTTIYGASSSILDNYERLSDSQKTRMINGIREDSEWLIGMVENLLSVTRLDSGVVKLIKTPTVLEELVDSVLLKFRKRYPEEKVILNMPDELVVIPMDAILIEQVIINMLENGAQHAKGHTALGLRVEVKGGAAVFEISDDGEGINKDKLEHLFTGYAGGTAVGADNQRRNAGIGLSVCYSIIRAHGGTVSAENTRSGALFRFDLATEEIGDEQ